MADGVLLGYKRFKAKSGNDCCMFTIVRDAKSREKSWGQVGQVAEENFAPTDQVEYLNEKMIGKEMNLYWDHGYLDRIEVLN